VTCSSDVYRSFTPEEAEAFFLEMREELRPLYAQAEQAASETLRVRPVFLRKQPFAKRAQMFRKALSLRVNRQTASEILAAFFLERYEAEVAELLDMLGLEHEDGVLQDQAPAEPEAALLEEVVGKFLGGESPLMRSLLLRAFAAQAAIDWPALNALAFAEEETVSSS
jgi:hypothetical protein